MNLTRPNSFPWLGIPVLMMLACSQERPAKPAASESIKVPAPAAVPSPGTSTGWDEAESGSVLLLSLPETVGQAAVVLPYATDSSAGRADSQRTDSIVGNEFDLFDRSGKVALVSMGRATMPGTNEGCSTWPVASFREPPLHAWRVGFAYRTARPLVLDSLEASTAADSVSMTAEIARLSSTLTATGDPSYQGLPFVVRKAYRLKLAEKRILVGDVLRKINEEANPREEHLLLIAEQGGTGGEYNVAFHSRVAGSEEQVRTNEILAAVEFAATGHAALVVSFEYEDGGRVALVERTAPGVWKLVWRSAYTGC